MDRIRLQLQSPAFSWLDTICQTGVVFYCGMYSSCTDPQSHPCVWHLVVNFKLLGFFFVKAWSLFSFWSLHPLYAYITIILLSYKGMLCGMTFHITVNFSLRISSGCLVIIGSHCDTEHKIQLHFLALLKWFQNFTYFC